MAAPLEKRIILADYGKPDSHTLSVYEAGGGYTALKKALVSEKDKWTPDGIINEVKASNLRGRGGAGFPTGLKWSFVPRNTGKPTYVVCNADESEPGTFKDRVILEDLPHSIIEGMILAGLALESRQGYIYLRGEFYKGWQRVDAAIQEAYAKGYLGENVLGSGKTFHLATYRGAGAYICGEETALLESLEGRRGHPRLKPPFPAVKGLYGSPTTVNNVETFAAIPHIINNGGEWFKKLGIGNEKSGGTKLFSVSGHVMKPGVYEVPMGISLIDFINETAGGIRPGKELKAVIPGGSSTPVMTRQEVMRAKLDYESMAELGTFLGSGGMIVLDSSTDMVQLTKRLADFYAHESCGQCTPCREGSKWIADIIDRLIDGHAVEDDLKTLLSFTKNMGNGTTICPFADANVMGVVPIVEKFYDEFLHYLEKGKSGEGK